MKKQLLVFLLCMLVSAMYATTVKLKITYNDAPVSDCDVTIKQGDVALGSDRTNSSGEAEIDVRALAGKAIDVYGVKKSGGDEKKWNVNGMVVLDDNNYAHLKMEVVAKEMADATGLSENQVAVMWGLVLDGNNDSQSKSSTAEKKSDREKENNDDGEEKKGPSKMEKLGNGLGKIAKATDGMSVKTETHSSSSYSGPDGSYSTSSSSKSETSMKNGQLNHSSSSKKSDTSFDDGGFNHNSTEKKNGGSVKLPTGSSSDKGSKDKGGSSSSTGSSLSTSKSYDGGSSEKSSSPSPSPEQRELERKKQESQDAIDGYDKQIVGLQSELMALRAEKNPDTITIGYKSNDLEAVKLKKEREQLHLAKTNARLTNTPLSNETQEANNNREAQIEFRLKQLEDLEKASKDDRRNEDKRREERKKALEEQQKKDAEAAKLAEKDAKEDAKFDTYSKAELKFKLIELKSKLGTAQANLKTTIDPEKKVEAAKDVDRLKAKVDRYQKRIDELEAKDEAEKKGK